MLALVCFWLLKKVEGYRFEGEDEAVLWIVASMGAEREKEEVSFLASGCALIMARRRVRCGSSVYVQKKSCCLSSLASFAAEAAGGLASLTAVVAADRAMRWKMMYGCVYGCVLAADDVS